MALSLASLVWLLASGLGDNLIKNGDLASANDWERAGPAEWLAHDDAVGSSKRGSLRIAVPKDAQLQPYNWYQRVELPKSPPERLELRASVKLDQVSGGSAAVMVQIFGDGPDPLGYAWTDQLGSSCDWRGVRGVFEVPRGAKFIRVLAYLSAHGTAWFDDLALEATDKPVTPPPGPAGAVDDELATLARGCAADLPWLFDGERALEAARSAKRPLLLYVRCTDDTEHLQDARTTLEAKSIRLQEDGYAKDLVFRAGPLSSPEVRDLIARRTIPVCATYVLSDSRFQPEKLAGLDALSSEITTPALLVFDERGKRVATLERMGTLSDDFVDHWLRSALDAAGAKSGSKEARELYRDGELERVLALTAKGTSSEHVLLRARTLLRLGKLEDARKALGSLASAQSDFVRGWIELRGGAPSEAREHFDGAAGKLEGDEADEARFWSAWCLALEGSTTRARDAFRSLASTSPLGRRAAACALDNGPRPYLAASVRSAPRGRELASSTEGAQYGPLDLARSVTALLELQREDGSFGESSGPVTQGFVDPTISAIAADALAQVEPKLRGALAARAKASRERAEAFLVSYATEEQPAYRAMEPFNVPYVIDTLLRMDERRSCKLLVERIARLQLPDGNWTVYNPERPASFNTALCARALWRADRAGIDVDRGVLARALDALEKMRQPSGRFPYSTASGHEWMTTEHGSIARDPLCEATLLECGRGSKDKLAQALQRFLEHRRELRAPTKRFYDYFNDRGHGGYYFFFAYRNALEAARAFAPKELQKKIAAATHEEVLAAQEFDGTWMDKFLLGRAYGTAMALLVLE
ncbi:MAG: tetratricopeptide repeat protein [Planctomycetes bacterium]|nr:tetratricopeptide repeat protein [Planctomycetota bacterium]